MPRIKFESIQIIYTGTKSIDIYYILKIQQTKVGPVQTVRRQKSYKHILSSIFQSKLKDQAKIQIWNYDTFEKISAFSLNISKLLQNNFFQIFLDLQWKIKIDYQNLTALSLYSESKRNIHQEKHQTSRRLIKSLKKSIRLLLQQDRSNKNSQKNSPHDSLQSLQASSKIEKSDLPFINTRSYNFRYKSQLDDYGISQLIRQGKYNSKVK